jgi:hypothetical protein
LPNKVKSVAVSFTIKPVTHRAEVDVNIASKRDIPLFVAIGKESSIAPIIIILI